jgi:hypothetical protein
VFFGIIFLTCRAKEKIMLTKKLIEINRYAQNLLREENLDRITAVELARRLHPDLLKDSAHRPGLPLRNLLRDKKILGAYQGENQRWFIKRIEDFTNIYSVKEIQEMAGFETPKPIYDRIKKGEIPQSTLNDDESGQKVFRKEDIIPWIRNHTNSTKTNFQHFDKQALELRDRADHLLGQIAAHNSELPLELQSPMKELVDALEGFSKDTPSPLSFQIPTAGNSITGMDLRKGQVRITKENKQYFPTNDAIVVIKHGSDIYNIRFKYRETRSCVLFIGKELSSKLNLRSGGSLSIMKNSDFEYELLNDNPILHPEKESDINENLDVVLKGNPSDNNWSSQEFELVGSIGELLNTKLPRMKSLRKCGVYKIVTPLNYTPKFKSEDEVEASHNVVSPWSLERLKDKWVNDTNIIYIGLAGARSPRSLRKRLSDLLRHASGRITDRGPHKGGELTFQISGFEDFEIWIKPTNGPPHPRNLEKQLLADFVNKYSKLPFANRQF